jgi:hypothetical protein
VLTRLLEKLRMVNLPTESRIQVCLCVSHALLVASCVFFRRSLTLMQVLKLLKQLLDAAPTSAPVVLELVVSATLLTTCQAKALAESLQPLTQDRAVLVQELASQLCAQLSSVAPQTKP